MVDNAPKRNLEKALALTKTAVELALEAKLEGQETLARSRQAEALLLLGKNRDALAESSLAAETLNEKKYIEGLEEEVYFVHARVLRANNVNNTEALGYAEKAWSYVLHKKENLREEWQEKYFQLPLNQKILEFING